MFHICKISVSHYSRKSSANTKENSFLNVIDRFCESEYLEVSEIIRSACYLAKKRRRFSEYYNMYQKIFSLGI